MNVQPTSEKAVEYLWFGQRCLAVAQQTGQSGHKAFTDGLLTIICKYSPQKAIVHIIGGGNFATNPIAAGYTFPAKDEGHLFIKDELWTVRQVEELPYGNIDWKSGGENITVLTWKGPPSRHFPLDPLVPVPGLTTIDEEITVDGLPVVYYTPFGPNVYEGGEKILFIGETTMPVLGVTTPKVLGACYRDGTLTVMVGTNYRGMVNPDNTQGGFFYELWVRDNASWARLAHHTCSRQLVPWFFNQSGTEASCVQDGVVWKCTLNKEVTFSSYAACQGTVESTRTSTTEETGMDIPRPALWEYVEPADYPGATTPGGTDTTVTMTRTKSQGCIAAIDYKGDVAVTARLTLTSTDKTEGKSHNFGYSGMLEEFPFDPPGTLTINNGGRSSMAVGNCMGAEGGCPPYIFTFSGPATMSESGCITAINCVTGSRAGGIVTVTDALGNTASQDIRLDVAGTWVRISHVTPCQSPNYSPCTDSINIPAACNEFGWNYDLSTGASQYTGSGFCKYPVCPGQAKHPCGAYVDSTSTFEYRCS